MSHLTLFLVISGLCCLFGTATKLTEECVVVDVSGRDQEGCGSISQPCRTPHYVVEKGLTCVVLRSHSPLGTRYYLNSTLNVSGNLSLSTFEPDFIAGNPPAELSGGFLIPEDSWFQSGNYGAESGLWAANISLQALGVSFQPITLSSIWVSGKRLRRARTPILHWAHSIDPEHQTSPRNHYGFVYNATTFPKSLSLEANSTRSWLITAFHQWATDVHTVRAIVPSNSTLLVNEPTYQKYGFDNNPYGAQRFFIENAPGMTPQDGEFVFTVHQTDGVLELKLNISNQPEDVVLPTLLTLVQSSGLGLRMKHVTLSHSAWLLPTAERYADLANARHRQDEGTFRGSGPLPAETSVLLINQTRYVDLDSVTFAHTGAHALFSILGPPKVTGTLFNITRCQFIDVGANAIEMPRPAPLSYIGNSRFRAVGMTWAQGTPLRLSSAINVTVSNNDIRGFASDGILLSSSSDVTVARNLIAGNIESIVPNFDWIVGDFGCVHTALPNCTYRTVEFSENICCNMTGHYLGGYGLYLDYGTSGVEAQKNLIFDTADGPMFINSNKNAVEPPGTVNIITNNIMVSRHNHQIDNGDVMKIRSLAQRLNFSRNVVYVDFAPTDPTEPIVVHGHTLPQLDEFLFDNNLYFNTNVSDAKLGDTWRNLNWTEWQSAGQDRLSLIGKNPLFLDADNNNFVLQPDSPAFGLGFQSWNYSVVGPQPPFSSL